MKDDSTRVKYSLGIHRERVEEEKMRGEVRNGFLSLLCCLHAERGKRSTTGRCDVGGEAYFLYSGQERALTI